MKTLTKLATLLLLIASFNVFAAETTDQDAAATICNDELEVSTEGDGEEDEGSGGSGAQSDG